MKVANKELFDPELPTASAVLASLCCVTMRYAQKPCPGLARMGARLARTLTAPQYAESEVIVEVAKRMLLEWESLLVEERITSSTLSASSASLH